MHSACRVRETTWQTFQDCCETGVSKNTSQSSKVRQIFINYSYSNKVLETVDLQQTFYQLDRFLNFDLKTVTSVSLSLSDNDSLSIVWSVSLVLSCLVLYKTPGMAITVQSAMAHAALNNLIIVGTWSSVFEQPFEWIKFQKSVQLIKSFVVGLQFPILYLNMNN